MENGKEEVQKIQQEIKSNADIMGKNLVWARRHVAPTRGILCMCGEEIQTVFLPRCLQERTPGVPTARTQHRSGCGAYHLACHFAFLIRGRHS
jgi:hypothetical protein